jgi:hypothetical protein
MTGPVAFALVLAVLVATSGYGHARTYKQEPGSGTIRAGRVVLVDDGTCGKGMIKQVTGGDETVTPPRLRRRTCIPK